MKFKRRIAIATAALSFAAVGLASAPVEAQTGPQINPRTPDCSGPLTIRGNNRNESFIIYPNRVEIRERGSSRPPRVVRRGLLRSIFVIDTGQGIDIISAHNNVDFISLSQSARMTSPSHRPKPKRPQSQPRRRFLLLRRSADGQSHRSVQPQPLRWNQICPSRYQQTKNRRSTSSIVPTRISFDLRPETCAVSSPRVKM